MCILFIYTDPSPPKGGFRLIIASNRDEHYKRPARNAFLCPETNILGGRDMEPGREGGMWLGVATKPNLFKFGALLNVTGEEKKTATSGRGPLVYNYLKTNDTALQYIQHLKTHTYSSFNLATVEISGDEICVYHHSNSPEATLEYHGRNVLGFGNSTPDSPFTKVKNGKRKFEEIIRETANKQQLIEGLLELLKLQDLHLPDPELEKRAPQALNFLSSIYVHIPQLGYGTRTHSIVLVDDAFNVDFVEHTMKAPIDSAQPTWDITALKSQL